MTSWARNVRGQRQHAGAHPVAHAFISDDYASHCCRRRAWHLLARTALGPGPDARVQTQPQRTRPCACLTTAHPTCPAGSMHKKASGCTHHLRRGVRPAIAGAQHATVVEREPAHSPCASAGLMSLATAEAPDRGPHHDTVLPMDHARGVGEAQLLGRTALGPGPAHTPVRSEQGAARWGAHPALGTHNATPGPHHPAVHTNPHHVTTTPDASHTQWFISLLKAGVNTPRD